MSTSEMSGKAAELQTKAEPWVFELFDEIVQEVIYAINFHRATIKGLETVRLARVALERIWGPKPFALLARTLFKQTTSLTDERARDLRRLEPLIEREAPHFSTLTGNLVVYLWTLLEDLVRTLLIEIVSRRPELLTTAEVFHKIKVPVGEYESFSAPQKSDYLVHRLEQQAPRDAPGIARFENLLGHFGLTGPLPPDERKSLVEMQAVRNLLVHRRGYVDSTFMERCPWMDVKRGDKLVLKTEDVGRYSEALRAYVDLLVDLCINRFPARTTSA